VRIDAAKVRRGQNVCCLDSIFLGNTEMKEDASAEFAEGIDVKNFGLDGGHVRPFSEANVRAQTSFARTQCAANAILAEGKTIGQALRAVK